VKRGFLVLVVIVVVLILGILVSRRSPRSPGNPQSERIADGIKITETHSASPAPSNQSSQLLGDVILRDYAKTNTSPQNDLTLMSHLMQNSLLLLKSAGNRPLSANEDWADFLKGKNSAHEQFLPDNHVALNSKGQLVDRWSTPLFFHALGGGRYDIRSAGPDKTMWTSDDIHLNANGSFRNGSELNPSALSAPARQNASVPK
jgi:hypothetical protein